MTTTPTTADAGAMQAQDKWGPLDDTASEHMGPVGGETDREPSNGAPLNGEDSGNAAQEHANDDYRSELSANMSSNKTSTLFREKQVKVPTIVSFSMSHVPRYPCKLFSSIAGGVLPKHLLSVFLVCFIIT